MFELLPIARHLRGTVPISKWTLVFTAIGLGVSLLSWKWLARRAGWRPLPTLWALLALTGALALTLSPRGGRSRNRRTIAECIPVDWAEVGHAAAKVGGSLENVLNIGLLMPLGFALVLASRRVAWPAVLMLLLPAAIELSQTSISGRLCTPADWMANALGGLIGVAAGWLVQRRMPAVAGP